MTDNEIINALKHDMYFAKGEDGFAEIYWERLKGILDLINRQKAEIEKLERTVSHLEDYANGIADKVKAEAIKEFAERLKKYTKELKIGDNIYLQVVGIGRIDNLVEEMVGDKK